MIKTIPLPADLLNAPAYQSLTPSDKIFVIELYAMFHDTERFTIEMDKPANYRQPGTILNRKVARLLDIGLLKIVGSTGRADHARRVFTFAYPAMEEVPA